MLDRQKEKTLILFSIYARDENVIRRMVSRKRLDYKWLYLEVDANRCA